METDILAIAMAFLGTIMHILWTLRRVLEEKQFDLNYWWEHNKWATIGSLAGVVGLTMAMDLKGLEEIGVFLEFIVPLIIGLVTNSAAFEHMRKRGEKSSITHPR